jgi:nuclear transcription factor Y alpha
MRRPRGPGGRFLTAEEIAAQKTDHSHLPVGQEREDDIEDDDQHPDDHSPIDQPLSLHNPQNSHPDLSHTSDHHINYTHSVPSTSLSLSSLDQYSLSLRTHPANSSPRTPSLIQNSSVASSLSIATSHTFPHPQRSPRISPSSEATSSVPLRSPYSVSQMHHVPHPHAHARHHHSRINYSEGLYDSIHLERANGHGRDSEITRTSLGMPSRSE